MTALGALTVEADARSNLAVAQSLAPSLNQLAEVCSFHTKISRDS